jgi:hypothetical protein
MAIITGKTLEEVEKLKQGQLTLHFENRYICKNGQYIWLSWKVAPDVLTGNLYCTARDVSEEKKKNEDTLGRKYSAYNSFRIQDLRDMKISILKNIEDQKRVFDLFEKKYDELLSANLNIESFVNCLSVKSIK